MVFKLYLLKRVGTTWSHLSFLFNVPFDTLYYNYRNKEQIQYQEYLNYYVLSGVFLFILVSYLCF